MGPQAPTFLDSLSVGRSPIKWNTLPVNWSKPRNTPPVELSDDPENARSIQRGRFRPNEQSVRTDTLPAVRDLRCGDHFWVNRARTGTEPTGSAIVQAQPIGDGPPRSTSSCPTLRQHSSWRLAYSRAPAFITHSFGRFLSTGEVTSSPTVHHADLSDTVPTRVASSTIRSHPQNRASTVTLSYAGTHELWSNLPNRWPS